MSAPILKVSNCQAVPRGKIPRLVFSEFRGRVEERAGKGFRVVSFWCGPDEGGGRILTLVLADDKAGTLEPLSTAVKDAFASLTPRIPQVHLFEREIFEGRGVRPQGHPWLKPLRCPEVAPSSGEAPAKKAISPPATNFLQVRGAEIHEVAVGPVHAGIIEPGHFRFQCHGEEVLHLEISLGYQHRGIEKALVGGPDKRTIHYLETAAGDTTVAHTLAYCQAREGLSSGEVPLRGAVLRAIMLELERLANHTGDLGALANDVGYLPTSSYCGRLRGEFLNLTAVICGNRFGRNMIRPGGVSFDLDPARTEEIQRRLEKIFSDVENAVSLLWESALVLDRFDETGIVFKKTAEELGLVGVAVRGCGIERDVRRDFPTGAYKFAPIPVSVAASGDVFARAFVRWLEIKNSVEFIRNQLRDLPQGEIAAPLPEVKADHLVVSLVEGWRGEICHCAVTDKRGRFAQYKIVDPSFHNWMGLAMALRGEEISNFPLCNKSFNLSYCGHDL